MTSRHYSRILGLTLGLLLTPLAAILIRSWLRRGGRYVVFVYSNSPNWQEYVEQEILPRLPEHTAVLNWSERQHWSFWSAAVWLFTLFGGYREFNPLGIVIRRWRWPRVFRFWRAFRDRRHGGTSQLDMVQRDFLHAAGPGPAVELFDEGPDYAALSWTGPRARVVALAIFVELARRLEGEDSIWRLRLDGEVGEPIDVATVEEFVAAAPAVLIRLYADFSFTFHLNDSDREYVVRRLDKRVPGIWFRTPEQNETFWETLGEVLSDVAARSRYVRVSGGPWYEDAAPFR